MSEMRFMPIDGAHGWASNLWNMISDGGIWGVPRCGLMYRKEEAAMQLVLFARMPWEEDMPGTPEALLSYQDQDHAGIRDMFAAIGVEVVVAEEVQS
jgi:hypothetical protein